MSSGDAGLTLLEMLIVVMITGLIVTTIASSIVVSLQSMERSSDSLGDAANTLLGSTTLGPDVQEATSFATTGAAACGTGTLLMNFRGSGFGDLPAIPATAPTPYDSYVSYVTEVITPPSGPNTLNLLRKGCWAAAPAPGPPRTPVVQSTLATGLSSTSPPTVACYQQSNDPATIIAAGNLIACTDPGAHVVLMTLTLASTNTQFQLIGTRRTQ